MPTPPGRSNVNIRPWIPVVVFALIFAGSCALNAINIGFPVYWHPDEIAKASQIQTGDYNFNHPLLMLRLATLFHALLPLDQSIRDTVLAGRFVSIATAALAASIFGLLIARRFGILFGLATTILIALTPLMFIRAHFFKEEATLMMGIALVMLAIQSVDTDAKPRNIALLGAAVGLAAAAKYVGGIMIVPAIAILISKRVRWMESAGFLLCIILVFVAINSAGIIGHSSLETGLFRQIKHVATSHDGVSRGMESAYALLLFWRITPAAIVTIWVAGMLAFLWRRLMIQRRGIEKASALTAMDGVVVFTPLLQLAMISLSAVITERYVLPATVLAIVAAVWIVASVASSPRSSRAMRIGATLALLIGGVSTIVAFAATVHDLRHDARTQLRAWIAENLPPDAKIAAEFYAGLPTEQMLALDQTLPSVGRSIERPFFHLAMAGSLASLREQGFTHIVISSVNFARFIDPVAKLTANAIARKEFYQSIFSRLTPIHEETSPTDLIGGTLGIQLLVYDIRSVASAKGNGAGL